MKHGHLRNYEVSPTYNSWLAMKQRCFRTTHKAYPKYGGRGITVCSQWMEFERFLRDMGERPFGKTLERKDNNGNYEPSNCKWATRKEQQRNLANNVWVSFQGRTEILSEWARITGLKYKTIEYRYKAGWPLDEVFVKLRPNYFHRRAA